MWVSHNSTVEPLRLPSHTHFLTHEAASCGAVDDRFPLSDDLSKPSMDDFRVVKNSETRAFSRIRGEFLQEGWCALSNIQPRNRGHAQLVVVLRGHERGHSDGG